MRSMELSIRRVIVTVCLLTLSAPALAQEFYGLPLTMPGQATVSIDRSSSTAYIVDLGKYQDGKTMMLGDRPLLDALADAHVKRLVFVCSHPHSDHMGGIRALFEVPRSFFNDDALTGPRFESVTVVENAVQNSLTKLLREKLPSQTTLRVQRLNAASTNALAEVSSPSDEVYVETLPYTPREKAGPHGRTIVTRTVLGRSHSIVDFDDADSHVIRDVVTSLEQRGIRHIDSFVVPHHGSAAHDIAPIMELEPRYAIVSVNPANQYLHPSPEIVIQLIEKLGADHVVFTGCTTGAEFGPTGLRRAAHTAADFDSYALFVLPGRQKVEQRGRPGDAALLAKYEELRQLMLEQSSHRGVGDEVADRVAAEGTMLSPEADIGLIPAEGSSPEALALGHLFGQPHPTEPVIYLTAMVPGQEPPGVGVNTGELATRTAMSGGGAADESPIEVRFDTDAGMESGLEPRRETSPRALREKPKSPPAAAAVKLPEGGMVYFAGDKLTAPGNAADLVGGTLDLCDSWLCLRPAGGGPVYTVPVTFGPLFCEVWRRVYDDRVDEFYLSINPTRRFLRERAVALARAPTKRLEFGAGKAPSGGAANEVVTLGGIKHSQIGRILWDADVLFKSAALGFDVATGETLPQAPSGALSATSQDLTDADLDTYPDDRWCRLCWTSGAQRITVDGAKKRLEFRGDAVVAQAEAMTLSNGKLERAPQRSWCADAQALAKALQRKANGGASKLATLAELRRLAQMQSFIRWVRDNGVAIGPTLRDAIEKTPPTQPYNVPTWTSGIRSDPRVLVQEERTVDGGTPAFRVHVSFADPAVLTDCVEPAWNRQDTDFPRAGFTFNRATNTWEGTGNGGFLRSWMTALATGIAHCSNGVVLTPDGVYREEDDPLSLATESRTTFKYVPHIQPISYHGGVLLGPLSSSGFLKTAWQEYGVQRGVGGHLLFQRVGSDLHFWTTTPGSGNQVGALTHVVVHGGKIIDAFATEGRIRYLVEAGSGATVREEFRSASSKGFSHGLEWARVRHGRDGGLISETAIWPKGSGKGARLDGGDLVSPDVKRHFPHGGSELTSTRVALVEPSVWVVDLDIASIKRDIDARWEQRDRHDASAALAVINTYANWGFRADAAARSAGVVESIEGETQDTNLEPGLVGNGRSDADSGMVANAVGIVLADLADRIDQKKWSPAAVLAELRRLERLLAEMPPTGMSSVWSDIAEVCDLASARKPMPKTAAELTSLHQRLEIRAMRAAALDGQLTSNVAVKD